VLLSELIDVILPDDENNRDYGINIINNGKILYEKNGIIKMCSEHFDNKNLFYSIHSFFIQ
jgi:hypothetical protein